MNNSDGPTKRILFVLELLYKNGPMTLAAAAQHCSFSRAAVWRALDTLREMGWVRMRLGDNAFVLLSDKFYPNSNLHFGFPMAEKIVAVMQHLEKDQAAHVCLGAFIDGFGLRVLESTRRESYASGQPSLVNDGLAVAAQIFLGRKEIVVLLRDYMTRCPRSDRRMIEDGTHGKRLNEIRTRGYLLSDDSTEVVVPLRLAQRALALRVRAKSESLLSVSRLLAAVQTIQTA